jgi:NAD(P)-dependent dehydrogenase (short-subunit alcohol dehydrogenase family)
MNSPTRIGAAILGSVGAALATRAWRRRDAIDFAGKVVVITGGSRGLGLAMAREFGAEGARLAILARDRVELDRAEEDLRGRGVDVRAIVCDIRERDDVETAIKRVLKTYGRIDVLVNNAGVIQCGPIEHMELEDFEDAMATHLWGHVYTTFATAPHMRRQGGGRIVNISSIGGKIAAPHLVPYCTSKFALTGFSEGTRAEFAKYNIKVTTVCPGLMRTGSHLNAFFKGQHQAEFAWFSIADALPVSSMDARRAARQIVEACRAGDPDLTITIQAQLATKFNALFPELSAGLLAIVDRLLPKAIGDAGDELKSGWESRSAAAPSTLTRLADEATAELNGLRGHAPIVKPG